MPQGHPRTRSLQKPLQVSPLPAFYSKVVGVGGEQVGLEGSSWGSSRPGSFPNVQTKTSDFLNI